MYICVHSLMKIKALTPLFLIGVFSCQNNSQTRDNSEISIKESTQAKEVHTEKKSIKSPLNESHNNFCRLLAGDTNLINSNTKHQGIWKQFASESDKKWTVLNSKLAVPISKWVSNQSYNLEIKTNTLLYPFAGGDYFYANLFFPKKDTIIMVGLEPSGTIFNPKTATKEELEDYLKNLEHSLFFPHKLGFFRTKSMAVDFEKGLLNGTLHTCLYYLAKFGNSIHYIKTFNLSESGEYKDVQEMTPNSTGFKGYRIGYSAQEDNEVKELIYFRENLANSGLRYSASSDAKRIPAYHFLNKKKNVACFFKAATYLMHKDYFSDIRNICLNNGNVILQDDSGIKLEYFKPAGFSVTYLGEYTRTIPLFSNRFQEDLAKEYINLQPKKLPFVIGYNAQYGECNLQLAIKK